MDPNADTPDTDAPVEETSNYVDGVRVYPPDEPRRAPWASITGGGNNARIILEVDHIYIDVTHATQDEVKKIWPIVARHQAVLQRKGLSLKRSGPEGTRNDEAQRWLDQCTGFASRAGRRYPLPDDIKKARDAFKKECKDCGLDFTQEYKTFWYPYVQRTLKRKINAHDK